MDYYIVFARPWIKALNRGFRDNRVGNGMTNRQFTIVRDCAAHADEIAGITRAAFARQYGSGDSEAALIPALRACDDVVVELAALEDAQVVGHAMFSRLTVEPATRRIAALGPVCARVDRQRRGIGSVLVRAGLDICREQGFDAVALLGDPNYYSRFGFKVDMAGALQSAYSGPHFQALELRDGALASGPWRVAYPRAFD